MFYGKKIDVLVVFLESVLPFIGDRLSKQLIKQRATLTGETVSEERTSIFAGIWDIMLTIMIGYFVISLVHSAVNDYRAKHTRNSKEDSKKAK